ncbi:MAG: bifunctional alpha,alpha-trehalose-phosphate synthase (UDP-forming)/trehalose-phosphatase [Polyangiaceae bacterium UTPRO1]|nr:bifunctional alpha,alpha-trehalose-phosphate synthase (UDP-forming)/trehalose-phosphatase [Myxococcales bacterium]OQY65012.1 MAG: bifunctional alpha,alpha-trehalose-phosphate synthase (UDP-forming)/trehalose-phosphatase [Polyangiaceae bacterium UTPRO1]
MPRVVIVANRLPVAATVDERGRPALEASPGGLVSGLAPVHGSDDSLWIGWPGTTDPVDPALAAELAAQRLVPVPIAADELRPYYDGFANGVIWPLFHYLLERMPLEIPGFDAYRAVNERFAEVVAAHWREGDLVWIHDYQLLLLPALVRRRLPRARIGFFLHVPFPSSEVFRTLPYREQLLEGLLGADLIGFHTAAYMRHFATSVLRVLGAPSEVERLPWRGREVRLGVFPMGIDAAAYAQAAARPEVAALARTWCIDGVRILLGVDRLDYTKGIPRRLLAFERLLEHHPELREAVRLVQVAVPSREDVQAYQSFREQADALIGRIHGAFATPSWVPVHWMYRGVSHDELLALYRAADVMLVTPLRDGMNLVAKEFCAARGDEDGVLVLSEFAGAASELAEAIMVNPFDVEEAANAYHRALTLPPDDRRARMRALRARIFAYDAKRWAAGFLAALTADDGRPANRRSPTPAHVLDALADRLRATASARLLLDYDGTLVPFAPSPDLARPDAALTALLAALAARPGWEVHIVSGRSRENLERWFGTLPIGLHAEHGLWSRAAGASAWSGGPSADMAWRAAVAPILDDFAARTPGSVVETKEASLAWHYRACERELALRQARELHAHLTERLSNLPVRIVPGDCVLEIRPHGASKGNVVAMIRAAAPPETLLCALGDDHTDGDMFRALGNDDIAIQIGDHGSGAPYVLADPAAARAFLRSLLAGC